MQEKPSEFFKPILVSPDVFLRQTIGWLPGVHLSASSDATLEGSMSLAKLTGRRIRDLGVAPTLVQQEHPQSCIRPGYPLGPRLYGIGQADSWWVSRIVFDLIG